MKKFFALLIIAGTALTVCAQVKISEFKNGKVRCVQVENSFYRIIIAPQIGGKIIQFFDKVSNTNLTRLKELPVDPVQPIGHVGMLDDRSDFVMANFDCAINTANPGQISVTLSATSPTTQVMIRKKLTFFDNSPVINVRYRYSNYSHENITGFALGIRNLFYPSGDGVSTDDRYFFPTTHTLRRMVGYTLRDESGAAMPEMAAKLDTQLGAPYHALLNLKKRSGIAFSFEDDYYAGYHIWKGSVKYPTYEWTYRLLPAGHQHDTEFNIIQVNGMDSIAYASSQMLAGVTLKKSADRKISVATVLKFIQVPREKLALQISCRAINWKWNSKVMSFPVKDVARLKDKNFSTSFKVPADGLYVVEQQLVRGRRVVAEWREVVTFGKYTSLPVFQIKYRRITESAAIPGWEAPALPKMEVSAADKQRGFAVLNDRNAKGYTACPELALTIASNEFESYPLTVASLGYNGDIKMELKKPANFPARLRYVKNYTLKGSGNRPITPRILDDADHFELEENTTVYLTVGERKGVKPGVYKLQLIFNSSDGKSVSLPVSVKVLDLALPRRNAVNLEAEGYPMLFPGTANSAAILNGWYKNMRDHGIDYFQFVGRIKGKTPNINFLDHYIDNALRSGLVIFKAARYDISEPSAREKANWQMLGSYLRGKGFQDKDIFVKILDEQPSEKYPLMGKTGRWLKQAGFRPFSTFCNLFSRPEAIRLLQGQFEMFQGGYTSRADYLARLKDGTLRPTDVFCRYTGSGTTTKSYETMLYWGMQTAALENPLFHNHEYMRGGNRKLSSNIIRIGDDDLPQDSPAFEGLRDGMDIANFAALGRRYLQMLPADRKPAFAKRFAEFFGTEKSAFKVIQRPVMGVINDVLAPMTTDQYRAAREGLLLLLADMKAALGDRIKNCKLCWNDLVIASPESTVTIKASSPEEKEAAAYFMELIRQDVNVGKNAKPGVTMILKLGPVTGTYKISRNGNVLTVTAATKENLKLAVGNWFNTFELK